MKSISICTASLLLIVGLLAITVSVQADPWPNYLSHVDEVSYAQLTAEYDSGLGIWKYYVSLDAGAVDPTFGPVIGIKALAVYPESGVAPEEIPGSWTGYDTAYTRPHWDYDGGYETGKGAFGYQTGAPSYYVLPGESMSLIGAAAYPTGYNPWDLQGFLLHVVVEQPAESFWVRPEGGGDIVPEPASITALAVAGLSLGGLIYRRRRKD